MMQLSRFWKVRLTTFVWGLVITYLFTGSFYQSLAMFTTIVVGNTIIMRIFL